MEVAFDPLQLIEGFTNKRYALPIIFVLGAFVFSKISRLALWSVFLFGSLPFLLIFLELPLADSLREEHPLILVLFGWLILMVLALGRALAKFFLALFRMRAFGWRIIYTLGTLACLGLVTALYFQPERLEQTFPGWEGSFGILLFSFALFSFTLSFVRLVKGGIVFSVWALLCLVIGSEVFLGKLPDEILSAEIREVGGLFGGSSGWSNARTKKGLNIVSMGVTSIGALGVGSQGSYTEKVSGLLSKNFGEGAFSLKNLSEKNAAIGEIFPGIKDKIATLNPQLAVFADEETSTPKNEGWSGNNSRASSDAGVFSRISFFFNNSRLYRFISQTVRQNLFGESQPVSKVQDMRGRPRFDKLPAHYVAIDLDKELERSPYDLLFVGDGVLSQEGHKRVAEILYKRILELSGFVFSPAGEPQENNIPSKYFSLIARRDELKSGVTVKFELKDFRPSNRLVLYLNEEMVSESTIDQAKGKIRFKLAETENLPVALKLAFKVLGPLNEEILFSINLVELDSRKISNFALF